jgi:hypothetical protein
MAPVRCRLLAAIPLTGAGVQNYEWVDEAGWLSRLLGLDGSHHEMTYPNCTNGQGGHVKLSDEHPDLPDQFAEGDMQLAVIHPAERPKMGAWYARRSKSPDQSANWSRASHQ